MRLLKMRKISEGDYIFSEEEAPLIDYMVKLETSQDDAFYREIGTNDRWAQLDAIMEDELGVKDEDVAYYLMAGEHEPEVGETFELDNYKWERIG